MRTIATTVLLTALVPALAERLCAQPASREAQARPIQSQRKKNDRQGKPADTKPGKKAPITLITVELLTAGDGVGLKARRWSEILSKLDVTLTVRPARGNEKLEVTEGKAGATMRSVLIKGMLDNTGRLIFPEHVFTENDTGKLAAWLDELRTYGAQGDPDGRPAWGLTKEQFGVIYAALKKPLAFDSKELQLNKALDKFELPKENPLHLGPMAARRLKERGSPPRIGQSLKGISQGTALAIILSEQGLGFRPRRLPDGAVELTVAPLDETSDVWPTGWPRKETLPATVPALFEFKSIDLEDVPLDAVLEAAAEKIGVPILIDRAGMDSLGIDLAEVTVSHPRKRTTWITALTTFTFKARSKPEVLIDEAGKPFVWIAPLAAASRTQKE